MTGSSLIVWLAITGVATEPVNPEVLLGMLGPLASAVVTWVVTARTFASSPERLTQVMVGGFGAKMLFFGGYVVAALRGLELRPTLFVVSFAGFFIALHVVEALFLRRLFLDSSRAVTRA
jgi:hypothetical protein